MRKRKQFRKIEWALRNSYGKKKKKLSSWYSQIIILVMAVWLKKIPKEKISNKDSAKKYFLKISEEKKFKAIKCALKNSRGRKRLEMKYLFEKLFVKAKSLCSMPFRKENTVKNEYIHLKEIPTSGHSSINYYDDQQFIYTKNRSYKETMYLRCKHSIFHSCNARAIVKKKNFEKVLLVEGHNHKCNKKEFCKTIFAKTLERICIENPFETPLKCYEKAKSELKGQIERKHIPMATYYSSFIHRIKKCREPLLPKTIAEFKTLIKEVTAKKHYAYDDDDNIFYRGIWKGISGRNIAFVSERTLRVAFTIGLMTLTSVLTTFEILDYDELKCI